MCGAHLLLTCIAPCYDFVSMPLNESTNTWCAPCYVFGSYDYRLHIAKELFKGYQCTARHAGMLHACCAPAPHPIYKPSHAVLPEAVSALQGVLVSSELLSG